MLSEPGPAARFQSLLCDFQCWIVARGELCLEVGNACGYACLCNTQTCYIYGLSLYSQASVLSRDIIYPSMEIWVGLF